MNSQIYHLHLTLANTLNDFNDTWQFIHSTIERQLQREMQIKYKELDAKIRKLTQAQILKPRQMHNFYPRVINNTDIPFSEPEMSLLQKGLKYNLHSKRQIWLENLALEAETAVPKLPTSYHDV